MPGQVSWSEGRTIVGVGAMQGPCYSYGHNDVFLLIMIVNNVIFATVNYFSCESNPRELQ